MIKTIVVALVLILIAGCAAKQDYEQTSVTGIGDLLLSEQDLVQAGLTRDVHDEVLAQLGLDGTNCKTEEQTVFDASGVDYGICSYASSSLNNTQVIIELKKFANASEAKNAYYYDSSHLYSAKGIISKDEYGDQSLFRMNSKDDYMGNLDPADLFYYHLWFIKDAYLIHITSKGSKDAGEMVARIASIIEARFKR